jgi:Recombination endonuclease VII
MQPSELVGKKCGRLEVLMFAWVNEQSNRVWMCACECGKQIRFLTSGQLNSGNRDSCGCKRVEVSRERTTAMNRARSGQPRSAKGKVASQIACKKMNAVRHLKARHVLISINGNQLTGECQICGLVPLKLMRHRAGGPRRDQYLCWVGSLREHGEYANARVRFKGQALQMFNQQSNACAICDGIMIRGNGLANDGMVLDHCHTTGYIRGFLHQRCNKGLAMFLDSPTAFRKAADYLERS